MGSAAYLRQFGHIPDPLNVPGYIAVCAFFQQFFPHHTILGLITLQVLIDTAAIPLTWLLAKQLFGSRVAVIATVLVTFDSLLIVQPGLVLTEALYIPLLLIAINIFVAAYRRTVLDGATLALYVVTGLLAGLCADTRAVGLAIPVALSIVLLLSRHRTALYKFKAIGTLWVVFLIMIYPVCRENQTLYGHFSLSTSRELNTAILIIGPAKASTMAVVGPKLLDMWSTELGPNYSALPPYVLAGRAVQVSTTWARSHLLLIAKTVIVGQVTGFIAPNRRSWAAATVWLHPSARVLQVFYLLVAASRLVLALLALCFLVLWQRLTPQAGFGRATAVLLLVLLILGHIAGAGAVVMGRYFCPVAPYLDLLAAGTLASWLAERKKRLDAAMALER